MLDALETVPIGALRLQLTELALDHATLLVVMERDELLIQPRALHRCSIMPRGEYKSIVKMQKELMVHLPQSSNAVDQGMLDRALVAFTEA